MISTSALVWYWLLIVFAVVLAFSAVEATNKERNEEKDHDNRRSDGKPFFEASLSK